MGTTMMTVTQSTMAVAGLANPIPAARNVPLASWAPKRRSSRLTLEIAVELYGQGPDRRIFRERARTRVVSEHGALVSLQTDVQLDQVIVLVRQANGEEMRCQVVSREFEDGEFHVGIAFLSPSPKFWGVSFPPAGPRVA